LVLVLVAAAGASGAEEVVKPKQATPSRARPVGNGAEKRWAVVPQEPLDRTPKRVAAPAKVARKKGDDLGVNELRLLGDIKVLELREEEALLRVDGVEQMIRSGGHLKAHLVKSVSPERLVLVRPEGVDAERGETLIVVDFLGAGRSRVRMYAARDWTARPPRLTE